MRYSYPDSILSPSDEAQEERSQILNSKIRLAHSLTDVIQNKLSLPAGVTISRAISKILLPPLNDSLICPTNLGFDLVISKNDGQNYYYDGQYEPGTLHVMSKCLRANDTFVDAGASIGQMSFFAANIIGKKGMVLSFEPHVQRYSSLVRGIELNQMKNVVAYNSGLGEIEETLKLYINRASPSLISNEKKITDFEEVRIMQLDSVLEQERKKDVRMIKIDVEGFELKVLKGATRLLSSANAPIICMEHERFDKNPLINLYFLQKINNYKFFNLKQAKGRVSKLVQIKTPEKVRLHDNVFCFLEKDIQDLSSSGLFSS